MTPKIYITSALRDKTLKKHTKGLIAYSLSALMRPQTVERIERVSVKNCKTFSETQLAECSPEEYDEYDNPVGFDLNVGNIPDREYSDREFLYMVAHELVHLKQMMLGEYKQGKNKDIIWKGKSYIIDAKNPRTYWLSPWEIEARGYERALVELYLHEKAPTYMIDGPKPYYGP